MSEVCQAYTTLFKTIRDIANRARTKPVIGTNVGSLYFSLNYAYENLSDASILILESLNIDRKEKDMYATKLLGVQAKTAEALNALKHERLLDKSQRSHKHTK